MSTSSHEKWIRNQWRIHEQKQLKSMQINERVMKINETPININEHQWNIKQINGNQWKVYEICEKTWKSMRRINGSINEPRVYIIRMHNIHETHECHACSNWGSNLWGLQCGPSLSHGWLTILPTEGELGIYVTCGFCVSSNLFWKTAMKHYRSRRIGARLI